MPRADSDELLRMMLQAAYESGDKFELTIFCDGLIVSGTVIPDEVYFERLGLPSIASTSKHERESNQQVLEQLKSTKNRSGIVTEEMLRLYEIANELELQFIMMEEVTILGAGVAPISAPIWRGRLSHISGWIPGPLTLPN